MTMLSRKWQTIPVSEILIACNRKASMKEQTV